MIRITATLNVFYKYFLLSKERTIRQLYTPTMLLEYTKVTVTYTEVVWEQDAKDMRKETEGT